MNWTGVVRNCILMAQIACMHCLVVLVDSLSSPHLPRAVDVLGSKKFCWVKCTVPLKLVFIEGNSVPVGTGGIICKVDGLEGLVMEGARRSVEGRCVGCCIQRDKLLVLVPSPD